MKILTVENLSKSFGGIHANKDISFDVEEGSILGVIGPNGAGKTTFFDLISGFQTADNGDIFLNGDDISNSQPYQIARMGMIRTFQLTKVFDRMTVLENLMFSGSSVTNDSFTKSIINTKKQKNYEIELKDKSYEIMEDLNISHMADSYARELSGGQKNY